MEKLEEAVNDPKKGLKPYPNAAWRENFEVLLVALTVAMASPRFFYSPSKSRPVQCSRRFWVTPRRMRLASGENSITQGEFQVPSGLARIRNGSKRFLRRCEGQSGW